MLAAHDSSGHGGAWLQVKAPPGSASHQIWQAVRASSAAPYYLDDFKCGDHRSATTLTLSSPGSDRGATPLAEFFLSAEHHRVLLKYLQPAWFTLSGFRTELHRQTTRQRWR